ncbi:serine hydrolase domain-containing protein [Flexithrix dorotheae]|uniref:serine hydrolase domain-containing protein n=1 Tax=Flexithrix dorotheae TaxID=70993 RepID=UPI0003828F61|nr:serine hydrolase domain-containing protein [Flexithrix dorotheae]
MKIFSLLICLFFTQKALFAQTSTSGKIETIFQSFDQIDQPGLSVGVIKGSDLIFKKGYGAANLDYGIKNATSSLLDVGSIAKQFTAACIWTLLDSGKISLDDDVRKYLPELPFYGDTIKIRHMLNHTSGLRNYASILELAGVDYTQQKFSNQSVFELTCRQKGLNNIPGEKVLYGNTPYNLLTIIIERITNQSFGEYAKSHLFKPLGMKNTHFRITNTAIVKNRATGYKKEGEAGFIQINRIETCFGAGSLWSSVDDLLIWSSYFINPTPDTKDLMEFLLHQDQLLSGELSSYSRGVMVDEYKNVETVHHGGYTAGYRSQLMSVPELELSIVILTNSQSIDPGSLSYQVLDLFLENFAASQKVEKPYIHSLKELAKFEGDYQEINSSLKMNISLQGDTLKSKSSLGRSYISLVSKNKNTLHRLDAESVKYIFNPEDQSCDLVVYFGATPFYFERITLVDPGQINLKEFCGSFYSAELEVTYQVSLEDNQLQLSYPKNEGIPLVPGPKDEFGNGYRTNYEFVRNQNNEIIKLLVASEGTVKDIEFVKKS